MESHKASSGKHRFIIAFFSSPLATTKAVDAKSTSDESSLKWNCCFVLSKPELSRRHELIFINFFIILTPSACQLITKKWIQQCVNFYFFFSWAPEDNKYSFSLWAFRFAFCRSLMLLWIVDGSQCCQQRNKKKKHNRKTHGNGRGNFSLRIQAFGGREKVMERSVEAKAFRISFFLAQQILL